MHRTLPVVLACALAALALPAAAADRPLSYTYVEAGYSQTRIDGLGDVLDSDELDGYSGTISYGHSNGMLLFVTYGTRSKDARYEDVDFSAEGDLDLDHFRAGIGYAFGLSDSADWVTKFAYESATLGVNASADYLDENDLPATGSLSGEIEADAYTLETSVRARLGSRFTGYVGAGYIRVDDPTVKPVTIDGETFEGGSIDLDDIGADRTETYGLVGLELNIGGSWSLVGQGRVASDVKDYFVGIRSSL
ncbi:MAG: outer membrane beta-barrel protein [Pseudomonadota bacterium]|nr:outer membrane beta-barrel protein [Pseudomonadota bacterium]